MTKAKKNSAATRQALLDSAWKLLSKRGYSRTSLNEVAREAGLTRGALYWHFPDKFQLFKAMWESIYLQFDKVLAPILSSQDSPLERLRKVLVAVARFIISTPELKAIDEIMLFKKEGDKDMEKLYTFHMAYEMEKRNEVTRLLEAAIESGELTTKFEIPLIATAIEAILSGLNAATLYDDSDLSSEDRAELLINVFFNGLNARG